MKKLGRNDPCPCGSGKKYKHCCLKAEEARLTNDRLEAVPKALQWLTTKYGQAVRDEIDEGFFGGFDDEDFARLQELPDDVMDSIMANAMEWLVADGFIIIKDQEHRVAELLFARGGPLLSVEQRQWLEQLTAMPIRLYEIVDLTPGVSLTLRDVILPERPAILVHEKSGSQQANPYDLIAARIVPFEDHFELSGAVYPFPRHSCWDLLEELKDELQDVEPDSPLAKVIASVIIPDHWLQLFVSPFDMPPLIDQESGESLLFVTDHYRVKDWTALDQALSGEAELEGNHEQGWTRLFESEDGLLRSHLGIAKGKHPDRIKVSYHTQQYADDGRPWFEQVAGAAVAFMSRELSDPQGLLMNPPPNDGKVMPETEPLPPEVLTELLEKKIHQLYAGWADAPLPVLGDRTPREAIQTSEGLHQVKFVLHTYEHDEAEQAKAQHRAPISYDFLWQSLAITP